MSLYYRDLLKCRFAWRGRGPELFDCWGICMEMGGRAGKSLPDFQYSADPKKEELDSLIKASEGLFREIERPEPFCLATAIIKPPFVTHTMFVLDDARRFIHIPLDGRPLVERIAAWRRGMGARIAGFYRIGEDTV